MFACGTGMQPIFVVESGILGFGIRNPSSTDKWSGIQYLESGIHGLDSRVQDCLRFPHMGRSFDLQISHPSLSDEAGRKKGLTTSFIYLWLRQFVIESKQRRFWVTAHVNRKWNFCTLEPWFWTNFWANPLYKNKTLDNTNMVESRLIKREKGSLPVYVSLKNVTA